MNPRIRCHCGHIARGFAPSRGDGSAYRLRKHATPIGEPCPWRYRTYFDAQVGEDGPGIIVDDPRCA